MCKQCSTQRFDADQDEHQWWHCLLALHPKVIEGESIDEAGDSDVESTSDDTPTEDVEGPILKDATGQSILVTPMSTTIAGIVEEKLKSNAVLVEERLQALESKVEDRMSQLESKMEVIMAGLKELLARTTVPQAQAADH